MAAFPTWCFLLPGHLLISGLSVISATLSSFISRCVVLTPLTPFVSLDMSDYWSWWDLRTAIHRSVMNNNLLWHGCFHWDEFPMPGCCVLGSCCLPPVLVDPVLELNDCKLSHFEWQCTINEGTL